MIKKIKEKIAGLSITSLNVILAALGLAIVVTILGTAYEVIVWGWMLNDYNFLEAIPPLFSVLLLSVLFKCTLKIKTSKITSFKF